MPDRMGDRFDNQNTLAEWLQLFRRMIRGEISAIYAHVEDGTVWVKVHESVDHDRLPRAEERNLT